MSSRNQLKFRNRSRTLETLERRDLLSADPFVQDPDSAGWASIRNATSAQFSAEFAARKDDYVMVDIEVDEINGQERTAIRFKVEARP